MLPVPWLLPLRLRQVEMCLNGERLTESLIAEARDLAAHSVFPIDDIRASADYRRAVIADLFARFLEEAMHA